MGIHNDRFPPIIMDIEASGFGPTGYPIEIGYIDSSSKRFCGLIQPLPDWNHWDDQAQQTHGISRKKLQRHGMTAMDLAQELNRQLEGKTVYSDGWVVDHPWLLKLFFAVRLVPTFRLSSIELILNERQIEIWDATRRQVIQENQLKRHRASIDAYIIQQTWIRTYQDTRLQKKAVVM
ncbi:hypothetical protein FT643_08640 [Ketobacter sp. MCCC 1A13808]|uniref:hypothetical protein n=1 Tax=Ketobacter sp. MCCC 1A13808 TaxID=2602738 RepID=UPI000F127C77|nr:hypothetical protein [Ketobacter sp. MCCC 1A13808]MVF12211.1 hypothetical protein [Ketobacter sp. MCCC 1A13808]RLP53752.1 MAG: hypothetical protein D6160_14260 [Ketobacter sp.]